MTPYVQMIGKETLIKDRAQQGMPPLLCMPSLGVKKAMCKIHHVLLREKSEGTRSRLS